MSANSTVVSEPGGTRLHSMTLIPSNGPGMSVPCPLPAPTHDEPRPDCDKELAPGRLSGISRSMLAGGRLLGRTQRHLPVLSTFSQRSNRHGRSSLSPPPMTLQRPLPLHSLSPPSLLRYLAATGARAIGIATHDCPAFRASVNRGRRAHDPSLLPACE